LVGDIRPGIAGRIADRKTDTDEAATERGVDEALDRAAFDAGTD
jgi:hypothetical protein